MLQEIQGNGYENEESVASSLIAFTNITLILSIRERLKGAFQVKVYWGGVDM